MTRDWVEARSSLPIVAGHHLPIAYEFFGDAPMIAFCNAGWGGAMSFVWLIKQDVLLIDDRNWCIGFDGPSLVAQHINICMHFRGALEAYRDADKTVAVTTGYQPNLGHFYWNDVSGLEREARLSRLSKPIRFYQKPRPWSDIADLYPEVADRVEHVAADDLLGVVLADRRFVVRLTASAIDEALGERVYDSAMRALSAADPVRLAELGGLIGAKRTFKLFLNLRSHNKAWLEQEAGLSAVIETVLARFPKVLVYLDGMPDCQEAADALKRAFRGRCTMVDGLNASFAESLIWCFGCDAYVAVIGSGLVPLTWLADRPGVAHSNIGHHDQIESFWGKVRGTDQPLLLPSLDQIKDDGPGIYANYSIEPGVVCDLFAQILDAAATNHPPLLTKLRGAINAKLGLA